MLGVEGGPAAYLVETKPSKHGGAGLVAIREVRVSRKSRQLHIFDAEQYQGTLVRGGLRRCTYTLDGVDFTIAKNPRGPGLMLSRGRQPIAKAERDGLRTKFRINALGGPYMLARRRWYSRALELRRGPKRIVGTVKPDGRFGKDVVGDFLAELPLPERVFVMVLFLVSSGAKS